MTETINTREGASDAGSVQGSGVNGRPKLFYRLVRGSFRVLLQIFWRFRSVGQENIPLDGPVLLVGNHQSYLDPVTCSCGMKRELDFMARESLFKGWFGKVISNLNAFPVRRGEADMRAIRDIVDRLEQQRAVMIFPEGTRSADGQVRDFKNGFVLIARKAKAAIVPVAVDGTWDAWPRQRKLPRLRKIKIEYGQVITAAEVKAMDRDELLNKVTGEVRRLQNKLRVENGREPYAY
ncbi:MAG: 1-acyl-sn-glycerol-3-phosphate acyltransferase [Sedimentisphaerales bacterium]|nr:1-acyl-sn-glycerol-3-phosphate acyltransferase [Sedimentisphaerales bacterium]